MEQLRETSEEKNQELTRELSQEERALLTYQEMYKNNAYTDPCTIEFSTKPDPKILKKSFEYLSNRHPNLRTNFTLDNNGEPIAIINPKPNFLFEKIDLTEYSLEQAEEIITNFVFQSFDLQNGEPFRVHLVSLPNGTERMVINTHHIISDGITYVILARELKEIYQAFANDREVNLPVLEKNYSDYVSAQSNQDQKQSVKLPSYKKTYQKS